VTDTRKLCWSVSAST